MKATLSKNAKIKLALGIAIPVLVMIVTVSMLGVSFAWFSNENEVYIESISITTEQAYSVAFTSETGDNLQYRGQIALNSNGDIVDRNATVADDRPFTFATTIGLDTAGQEAEIAISFDSAMIYNILRNADGQAVDEDGNVLVNDEVITKISHHYVANPTDPNQDFASKIPYVFTWFFKEHEGGKDTRSTNYTTVDGTKTMMYYEPAESTIWYTPFGKLEFGQGSKVSKVNDVDAQDTYSQLPDKENITIKTDGETLYDFYIIFAPEDIFWAQFFMGLERKTVHDIYKKDGVTDNSILEHICGRSAVNGMVACDRVYYSIYDYHGSKFAFTAKIDVIKLKNDVA